MAWKKQEKRRGSGRPRAQWPERDKNYLNGGAVLTDTNMAEGIRQLRERRKRKNKLFDKNLRVVKICFGEKAHEDIDARKCLELLWGATWDWGEEASGTS